MHIHDNSPQDHYTRNEKGRLLKVKFSTNNETQGLKNFCSLDDLERGNFRALQGTGWFVIELEMKNQRSFFEQVSQAYPLHASMVIIPFQLTLVKPGVEKHKMSCFDEARMVSYIFFNNYCLFVGIVL